MRNPSFNLSIKFFIAFLSTSLMIVIVMVVAMQIYAYRSFWEYIHNVEATRLNELIPIFRVEYQNNNGWNQLVSNPYYWHELIKPQNSAAYSEKPPSMPSGFEFYLTPSRPIRNSQPPPPSENRRRPPNDQRGEPDDRRRPPNNQRGEPDNRRRSPNEQREEPDDRRRPPTNDQKGEPDNRKRPPNDQRRPVNDNRLKNSENPAFTIEHRLALFDENKKTLIGKAKSTNEHTLREIIVNGRTVGWLGLRNGDTSSADPLDMAFLKEQSEALYIVGAAMLVLAAVVSFFMSRHLIKPVKELIKGTRNLTARKFNTRIKVKSSDELGELAQDFNLMAQTLEHYEQMRQQWISDIAHELRTPLSVLRGEIEALQDGIRKANSQYLQSLHDEVLHLIKIVNDLHELSLAESGALHITKKPINILHTVRACLHKFEMKFVQRGILIVDELGNSESITIFGDKDRLTQVFSNIVANTLRYTDSPGCLIVSKVCKKNEVVIIFADTKPGVPTESLERIFDRLYRVDKSRSRELGGSGLGLSICKTIIEAHNGTIKAKHASTGGLQIIQTDHGIVKGQHETTGGLEIEITLPILFC